VSAKQVKQVLNKIFTDEDYRAQFHANPSAALQDLDLTDHEKSMLAEINITDIEESDLVVAHEADQSAIKIYGITIT
jgi:putative modified peptide